MFPAMDRTVSLIKIVPMALYSNDFFKDQQLLHFT